MTTVVEWERNSVARNEPVKGFSEIGKQKIVLESKMLGKPREKLKRRQSQKKLGGYCSYSGEKKQVRQRKKEERQFEEILKHFAKDWPFNWIRGHKEILFAVLTVGIWENSEVVSRNKKVRRSWGSRCVTFPHAEF